MYGMVNNTILEWVSRQYGEETAQEVRRKANLETNVLINMEQYPDQESFALVGASADILEKSQAEMLEEIGEYWIEYALKSDYGDLLRMAGDTLPEVLMNLDNLHVRIGNAFPKLEPPSFWCTEVAEESLHLHYSSHRPGMAPMIAGLIKGLGTMLGVTCTVQQAAFRDQGADHDVFWVQYSNSALPESNRVSVVDQSDQQ